jgi:hypothetical protein
VGAFDLVFVGAGRPTRRRGTRDSGHQRQSFPSGVFRLSIQLCSSFASCYVYQRKIAAAGTCAIVARFGFTERTDQRHRADGKPLWNLGIHHSSNCFTCPPRHPRQRTPQRQRRMGGAPQPRSSFLRRPHRHPAIRLLPANFHDPSSPAPTNRTLRERPNPNPGTGCPTVRTLTSRNSAAANINARIRRHAATRRRESQPRGNPSPIRHNFERRTANNLIGHAAIKNRRNPMKINGALPF